MLRWLPVCTLAASALLAAPLAAHGGTYIGPEDLVPPGGGGSALPTGPGGPTEPGRPVTPGKPGLPGRPGQPVTHGPPPVAKIPVHRRGITPPAQVGPDLTTWVYWWEINKDRFLNLKAKVHAAGATTGEGPILLGLSKLTTQRSSRAPTEAKIRRTVLPHLIRALETSDNRDVLTAAMVALAKTGRDAGLGGRIEPLLAFGNQEVRETAALSYGIQQSADALPTLRALLLDTAEGRRMTRSPAGVDLRTRTFAAYGLGLIGSAEAGPAIQQELRTTLWTTLIHDDSALKDIRVACVIALGMLQPQDPLGLATDLAGYLADESHDALVRAHCPTAIARLLRSANAPAPYVEGIVRDLLRLLQSPDTSVWVRQSAVLALGVLTDGDAPYAADVTRALVVLEAKGRDRQEKNYTAISLAYIGATAAEDSPLRRQITGFLIDRMQGGSTGYRSWAGLALGVMSFNAREAQGAVPALVPRAVHEKFRAEKNPSDKACYAIALGLMRNEAAQDDLRRAMEDSSDPEFRGYAAVALGLLGARTHRDYVASVVTASRRKPGLLRQASIGLGLMSDPEAVDLLLGLLRPGNGYTPPLSVLAATASALGLIGDFSSIDPLVAMLHDQEITPLGRAFAGVALGIVADKDSLPWYSRISTDLNYRATVDTLTAPSFGNGILDIR